jgi:hypothetical protein
VTEGNCVHIQCDPGYDYDDMFGGKADPCCVFDVVVGHLVFEQVHCVLRIAYCILRIAGALGPSIVSLNTKNLLSPPPPPPAYCVLRIAYSMSSQGTLCWSSVSKSIVFCFLVLEQVYY